MPNYFYILSFLSAAATFGIAGYGGHLASVVLDKRLKRKALCIVWGLAVLGIFLSAISVFVVFQSDRNTESARRQFQSGVLSRLNVILTQPNIIEQKLEASHLTKVVSQAVVPHRQFPLVVKVHINPEDILSIVNEGNAPLIDLKINWGRFTFNQQSFAQKQIAIHEYSYPSGGIPIKQLLPSEKFQLPLAKVLQLAKWNDGMQRDFPFPEIGIRVSFRDKQTGVKYACYKLVSSIQKMPEPWGDEVMSDEPANGSFWIEGIPATVIHEMKSHYEDGALDFHCDR